ncbi:MAG: FAD-dependent oxidoreductase [Pikeienuella sp.]
MIKPLNVIVAGAGIGGLAAAIQLARLGHAVTILEQAPAPAPVGSGFVLQPVGLAALADIGLADQILTLGHPISRMIGRTASGRVVLDAHYDVRPGAGQPGQFGLAVQRAALFELLHRAALGAGVVIRHNAIVASATHKPMPRVHLNNGEALECNLLIDALGLRSPLSGAPPRTLPYGAIWGLFDLPSDSPFQAELLEQRYERARRMAGVLPVGTSPTDATPRAAYFWSIRRDQIDAWHAAPIESWKHDALSLWPETAPLLAQVQSHKDMTVALYRHRTHAHPVEGRMIHLGDSWHATSPQLGQGANMALLDAAALGIALARAPHLDEALGDYRARRAAHIAIYQTASRMFTPFYQSDSRILPLIRDYIAAPLSRTAVGRKLISQLVAGKIGRPLMHVGLRDVAGDGGAV